MAKTSGRSSDIQAILTAAEKKVLDGTLGESLASATKQQLQALRKQARTLRDKWHDLFKRQTLATKRKPVSTDQANARSREKADVFGDAVKRVEAQLVAIAAKVTGTKPSKTKTAGAATKKDVAATAETPAAPSRARAKKVVPRPVTSKKARQAGKLRALAAEGTGQPITFDVKKQRAAKASATRARLTIDGEGTRRKGFVAANTKRNQARRDSR